MKSVKLIIVLMLAIIQNVNAQSSGMACEEDLSLFYHLAANEKNYLDAYEPWKRVFEQCPDRSKNTFIYGVRIVKAKIKDSSNDSRKVEMVELLMKVYDTRLEYFPQKEAYVKAQKATDRVIYNFGDPKDSYGELVDVLKNYGEEQSASFYNAMLISSLKLYKADVFNKKQAFEAYNTIAEGIELNNNSLNSERQSYYSKELEGNLSVKEQKILSKIDKQISNYAKVEIASEKLINAFADCEWLSKIYTPQSFEENKSNEKWLKRASKMLLKKRKSSDDCSDNVVFYAIAEQLHALNPSKESARAMGKIAILNKQFNNALKYLNEASALEQDPEKRSVDYYYMARIYVNKGMLARAKQMALKSGSLNTSWGKPYVLLARIYAANAGKCGENVFEKNAVYWAAIDKLNRAKSIDKSVAMECEQLIEDYKKRIPNKMVSFQFEHEEGDEYFIACDVDEKIVVDFF